MVDDLSVGQDMKFELFQGRMLARGARGGRGARGFIDALRTQQDYELFVDRKDQVEETKRSYDNGLGEVGD